MIPYLLFAILLSLRFGIFGSNTIAVTTTHTSKSGVCADQYYIINWIIVTNLCFFSKQKKVYSKWYFRPTVLDIKLKGDDGVYFEVV